MVGDFVYFGIKKEYSITKSQLQLVLSQFETFKIIFEDNIKISFYRITILQYI